MPDQRIWQEKEELKFVCLSDTHGGHRSFDVPDGDVLFFAGDYSGHGTYSDLYDFNLWLGELPHKYKVIISGNHDAYAEFNKSRVRKMFSNAIYLENEGVILDGVKIWGSPNSLPFYDWHFMKSEEELAQIYDKIPLDIDILITHTPPFSILDRVLHGRKNQGSKALYNRIFNLPNLEYCVFGHIHEDAGLIKQSGKTFINCCCLDANYKKQNGFKIILI